MWLFWFPYWRAYLQWRFRVFVYKTVAISALCLVGFDLLRAGWNEWGTLDLRVVATYSDISVTGSYANICLGLLFWYWAWLLGRRWFVRSTGAPLRRPDGFIIPWPWTRPL